MKPELSAAERAVKGALESFGIIFKAEGGERTKRDDWHCFAWRCTFETSPGTGPHRVLHRQDFYCGLGHVIKARYSYTSDRPKPPSAADVLHSMIMDGMAVDSNFHDWCADLGYSDDSLKALATYTECCRLGRVLRELLNTVQRETLAELLKDY
jgi:hypothetical protein